MIERRMQSLIYKIVLRIEEAKRKHAGFVADQQPQLAARCEGGIEAYKKCLGIINAEIAKTNGSKVE